MCNWMSASSTSHGPAATNSWTKAARTCMLSCLAGQACESGLLMSPLTSAKSAHPMARVWSWWLSPGRPGTNSRGRGKTRGSWSAWPTLGTWCTQVFPASFVTQCGIPATGGKRRKVSRMKSWSTVASTNSDGCNGAAGLSFMKSNASMKSSTVGTESPPAKAKESTMALASNRRSFGRESHLSCGHFLLMACMYVSTRPALKSKMPSTPMSQRAGHEVTTASGKGCGSRNNDIHAANFLASSSEISKFRCILWRTTVTIHFRSVLETVSMAANLSLNILCNQGAFQHFEPSQVSVGLRAASSAEARKGRTIEWATLENPSATVPTSGHMTLFWMLTPNSL
mmetsp:Transcript_7191/g.14196  ORF Transcript_7191/g.14196 Transcript_7191/m.14196 type:complete len:341 (+) Transcript_7191:26-1048(+)